MDAEWTTSRSNNPRIRCHHDKVRPCYGPTVGPSHDQEAILVHRKYVLLSDAANDRDLTISTRRQRNVHQLDRRDSLAPPDDIYQLGVALHQIPVCLTESYQSE